MGAPMHSSPLPKRVRSSLNFLLFLALTARDLGGGIFRAAQAGRLLPRLTLALPCHAVAHYWLFATSCAPWVGRCSLCIAIANFALCAVGYTVLILLYRHSVHTIFNRKIPAISKDDDGCYRPVHHPAVPSFNLHLSMLRPLEVVFCFLTAPLRVLPDVIILGETRCGTTNLCGHICSVSDEQKKVKCYTPFCAWDHPELDHKESFYFVGHYLGIVDPVFYRMAFPLKLTRWYEEKVKGNVFFCFDGCAQYLTSPSAPYLIAAAFRGKEPPPVLVACIRHPVEQANSWWAYENNFVTLGDNLGLKEWNTELRSIHYPPRSIVDALKFSQSEFVQSAYAAAETLVEDVLRPDNRNDSTTTGTLRKLLRGNVLRLPSWAITWPAGQLSTIGRSGKYAQNIERYNNVFQQAFGVSTSGEHPTAASKMPRDSKSAEESSRPKLQLGRVHLVPIESQLDGATLKRAMRPFLKGVAIRSAQRRNVPSAHLESILDGALERLTDNFRPTRRNSIVNREADPSQKELGMLESYFAKEIEWYSSVTS